MIKKDELSEKDIMKENENLSMSELSDVNGGAMYVEPGGKDGVFMNPNGKDGAMLQEDGRLLNPNGEDRILSEDKDRILSEGKDGTFLSPGKPGDESLS